MPTPGLKTLAVLSMKGGTGKTTLAVSLAVASHLRGRRALLAGIDPQRSASDAMKMRRTPGPTTIDTTGAKLFQLKLIAAREGYETLVIDTAGSREAEMVAAMNAADLCLLVTRPSFLDIVAAVRTADVVRRVGRQAMVVLNQAPSARQGRESSTLTKAAEALRFAGLPLAPVGLRSRSAYQAAMALGLSAEEWAPGTAAALEVGRLWDALAGQLHGSAGSATTGLRA